MDIFGFTTQGINYDKFRPRYPKKLISKCLNSLKSKNRYLDVATGTGQLLFQFAPSFKESKGIDISETMIKAGLQARESFLQANKTFNVSLEVSDVMNIQEQ